MDERMQLQETLIEHAEKERNSFFASLQELTPDQLISRAYEITIKEDFWHNLTECSELDLDSLKILASLKDPLDVFYRNWGEQDIQIYNDCLQSCMEDTAIQLIYHTAQQKYADPAVPVYLKSQADATKAGELPEWEASHNRNLACIVRFEQGYEKYCEGPQAPVNPKISEQEYRCFLKNWQNEFGINRCIYVLSRTVVQKAGDGVFSPTVIHTAKQQPYPQGLFGDPTMDYVSSVDPKNIEMAMKQLLILQRQRKQLER